MEMPAPEVVKALCEKYGLCEFAIFGSAVRDDFGPDSDVDVLVSCKDGQSISNRGQTMMELWDELEELFGRRVDLLQRQYIENLYLLKHIEEGTKVLHVSS